jgi:hypothetical protein
MDDLKQAAQQALEALTWCEPEGAVVTAARSAAIDALRAALEQEEQEPVAWSSRVEWGPRQSEQVIKVTRTKQEQYGFTVSLYTTPPRREWQGLTLLERAQIMSDVMANGKKGIDLLICAFEDALRRKNHD